MTEIERKGEMTDLLADGALGVNETCEFTGLSRAEIYRAMQDGRLKFIKHGRRTLVPKRAAIGMLAKGA